MHDTDSCIICGTPARPMSKSGYDHVGQDCPCCGKFYFSRTAIALVDNLFPDPIAKAKLSGWVREQNELRDAPEFDSGRLKMIAASPPPNLAERANRLLRFIAREQNVLGAITVLTGSAHAVTYAANDGEFRYITDFLKEQGLIKYVGGMHQVQITPNGYLKLEELSAKQSASSQGFVAMWFVEHLSEPFKEGFERGVANAGYRAMRVDSVEHSGKIDDEIIAQIRRSRFLVADFTGQRGGVYFEAGFAMGLNLPVIWTCHKDDFNNLHFDIRQFNCIDWKEPRDLADRLQKRIEAVVGRGPLAVAA